MVATFPVGPQLGFLSSNRLFIEHIESTISADMLRVIVLDINGSQDANSFSNKSGFEHLESKDEPQTQMECSVHETEIIEIKSAVTANIFFLYINLEQAIIRALRHLQKSYI